MSIAGDAKVYRWVPITHKGIVLDEPTIELDRVTSITGMLAKDALLNWYFDTTVQGVEILLDYVKDLRSIRGNVEEALEINRLRPVDVRDERAAEGTDAHEYLQALATTGNAKTLLPNPYHQAVQAFWDSEQLDVVASEQILLSLKHRYAGTCDLVVHLGQVPRVIVDLKTRGAPYAYASDHFQLAAYRTAWNEMHPDAPCSPVSYVLLAHDDGTWNLIESALPESAWLALVEVYRSLRKGR